MKSLFFLMLAFCCAAGRVRADEGGLYGKHIVVDAKTGSVKNPAALELARWLGQMTGAKFELNAMPGDSAIFLVQTNSSLAPAADVARLKDKGPEAFVLRSEGDNKFWIVGNTDAGISQGVYFYLDELGCRWFLPNDHWTIIPKRSVITVKEERVDAPAFRMRNFFGTGGLGKPGLIPVDEGLTMQTRWETWKTRNHLGGSIVIGGHAGEAFNVAHRAELEAHPEYLAEINGKRMPWGQGTKPCATNPDFVKLYVADRVGALKGLVAKAPDNPHSFAISVEPSDGGGYCTCEHCSELGGSTEQVFYLANQVAKEVAKELPGRHVSLLAYGEHAAVPNIAIESNVYVVAVPYGLQRTGLKGDELLTQWSKKVKSMGLYDYWDIPDWVNCLPSLSFRDAVPQKIRFWHEHSVDGFMAESTYCSGNAGILWYVASRLLWNPAVDAKALLSDFYEKAFGPATVPMKRMFDRWNDGFILTEGELALTYRDLQEAESLATDEATRARVDDFALYVRYIELYSRYQYLPPREHDKAAHELMEYMWRTYDSTMIQTYRMYELIANRYEKDGSWVTKEWPLNNEQDLNWLALRPVAHEELAKYITDGVAKYKPLEYDKHTYSTDLRPMGVDPGAGTNWVMTPRMYGEPNFIFWAAETTRQVEVQIHCGPKVINFQAPNDRFTVFDPAGKQILYQDIDPDGEWHTVTIPTTAPGAYRIVVFDQKLFFNLRVPENLPFVMAGGFPSVIPMGTVYFFVPKDVKTMTMLIPGVAEVRDGAGHPVKGSITYPVPPGQDGKVWSFRGLKSSASVIPMNIPPYFSLTPTGLILPKEVLPAGEEVKK